MLRKKSQKASQADAVRAISASNDPSDPGKEKRIWNTLSSSLRMVDFGVLDGVKDVETVIASLRAHLEDDNLQTAGLVALLSLSERRFADGSRATMMREKRPNHYTIGKLVLERCSRIVAAGGVEAIIGSLRANLENEQVQRLGMKALVNIIEEIPISCIRIVEAGG